MSSKNQMIRKELMRKEVSKTDIGLVDAGKWIGIMETVFNLYLYSHQSDRRDRLFTGCKISFSVLGISITNQVIKKQNTSLSEP